MSEWINISKLTDIPVLGSRIYQHNKMEIAIFRTADDQVFALDNSCPHKGGPLSEGIVHGQRVTCPLHNWQIDLSSGEVQDPDTGCSKSYAVKVEQGDIYLNI